MASKLIELGRFTGRRMGGLGCGPLGCGSISRRLGEMSVNLPVAGRINIPSVVSIQPIKALIGGGTASLVSGLITGVLGNAMGLSGAKYAKIGLGAVSALAFLSPKLRTNSYVVGFGFKNIVDMIEPFAQMIANAIMPPTVAATAGMGALTRAQSAALTRAAQPLNTQGRFIQMNGSRRGLGMERGETIMVASDYLARARAASPLAGSAIGSTNLASNQLAGPNATGLN